MFDVLMLVLLGVAFAGAVLYVRACVTLTQPVNGGADPSP
jgi:hypothetical protein